MKTIMSLNELQSIDQLKLFLDGTQSVAFMVPADKNERHRQVEQVLIQFRYFLLGRVDKGVVLRFLAKLSGYSRQQVTRLVQQYEERGHLRCAKRAPARGFVTRYTAPDIALLARMDELHNQPSGPVIKKLCERAFHQFGEKEHERLSKISISHLYNLRKSPSYRRQGLCIIPTQKTKEPAIGTRKKPHAQGQPGYLRVDSVHQGDQDKRKGVYHINAVDEVTQFEVVVTVERISENHMIPALEQIINALPFKVRGFHSDNGSEYINRQVAGMLEKLLVEFTKSRARHSNDNALAESKNGAVVRKTFGYGHIPQCFAGLINRFNQSHLVPYLNFHRPCFFPTVLIDKKGKEKKQYKYRDLMTPYEKLKSLPNAQGYLKEGVSFEILDRRAVAMSDNEAARQKNEARDALFTEIFEQFRTQG
jgi:transposase InsO family protein